jgi:hypothetical protein
MSRGLGDVYKRQTQRTGSNIMMKNKAYAMGEKMESKSMKMKEMKMGKKTMKKAAPKKMGKKK